MKTLLKLGIIIGITILSSCGILNSNLNKAMNQADGEPGSLSRAGDTIGEHVLIGVNKQLPKVLDTLTVGITKIEKNVDSLFPQIIKDVSILGDTGKFKVKEIGDNLNNSVTALKNNIKDSSLSIFLDKTIFNASQSLNKNTKTLLSNMVQSALDSLSAPTSKNNINLILDNILQDTTKLQKAIHATIQPTVDSVFNRVDRIANNDLPFVEKRASLLLILLAALALLIIGYVWYEKKKYAGLVEVLTLHIDKIKDPNDYDTITEGIKDEARKKKVEPILRRTLYEQGINSKV